MSKEELEEYRTHVMNLYDEYVRATENRGISWGEVAHIGGLNEKELDELCAELDDEMRKLGGENE